MRRLGNGLIGRPHALGLPAQARQLLLPVLLEAHHFTVAQTATDAGRLLRLLLLDLLAVEGATLPQPLVLMKRLELKTLTRREISGALTLEPLLQLQRKGIRLLLALEQGARSRIDALRGSRRATERERNSCCGEARPKPHGGNDAAFAAPAKAREALKRADQRGAAA